jgi:hypothetical protein
LPFFIDSNVIIGYYFFCGDRWGNQSKKVIEFPEIKHSSTTVWHECFGEGNTGKCKTIFNEIKDEFFNAIAFLTKEDYSPADLYILVVDEEWKIREIVEELVGRYEKDVKELVRKIRKAERRYEIDCDERLTSLKKPAILLIHNRDVEYPDIQKILQSVIEDSSDITILLDAHHVGATIAELHFLTGDYEHIVQQKDSIIDNTNLSNVVYLDSI